MVEVLGSLKVSLASLLCGSITALHGTRFLAYPLGMSQSLRSVRLALAPLATANQGSPR